MQTEAEVSVVGVGTTGSITGKAIGAYNRTYVLPHRECDLAEYACTPGE